MTKQTKFDILDIMNTSDKAMLWILGIIIVVLGGYIFWSVEIISPPTLSPPPASTTPPAADYSNNAQIQPQPQPQPQPQIPLPAPQSKQTQNITKHMITIKTSLGDIKFETYDGDAPNTVKNFITLAQKGFYDNVIFHRVIKGFMVQGGDPTGTGTGGPGYKFADELNSTTASYQAGYVRGVVAMANSGPNTNGSQFFIMLQDTPLPNLYTIFGKVVSGQSVVDAIGNLQTDANDRPLQPPSIKSVTVVTE